MIWSTAGRWWRPWKRGHWFQQANVRYTANHDEVAVQPCIVKGCGRPGYEHWTWQGDRYWTRRPLIRWRMRRVMVGIRERKARRDAR